MSGISGMIGRYIAANRRTAPVRALHRAASFVESAWNNEGASVEANGEERVIELLAPANFKRAIDVGANHGDWLLGAAAHWPQCRIDAFEVAPPTFETLAVNVAGSPLKSRLTLHNMGLGNREGTQQMFYFPEHPELTCDLPRHGHLRVPFEATLNTGDLFLAAAESGPVDFLKIDVEGAEFRVIQGFRESLAANRIHCLQFEYGAFSIQTRFLLADYYDLLQSAFWIGKIFHSGVEFSDYDWRMENFRFSNYCCVSRARPDLRALLETAVSS